MSRSPSQAREPLREFLSGDARTLAPMLLGAVLTHDSREGRVSVRLTEVEAYLGPEDSLHPDPGSHTYRGPTPRNAPMFGPAGHLYVYFTYGMHHCTNIVCGPAGVASALLLRAGEIVEGLELAQHRRPTSKIPADLASGPARLAKALGLTTAYSGRDALAPPFVAPRQGGCRCQFRSAGGGFRRWRLRSVRVAFLDHRGPYCFQIQGGQAEAGIVSPALTEKVVEWTVCLLR
jgi:DNA-3-methyladenine glycosylase